MSRIKLCFSGLDRSDWWAKNMSSQSDLFKNERNINLPQNIDGVCKFSKDKSLMLSLQNVNQALTKDLTFSSFASSKMNVFGVVNPDFRRMF